MAARGTKNGNGARARLKGWLTQLMMTSGLSGHEGPVRRLLAKQLSELGISSRSDRMGNLIAALPGDKSLPSVMAQCILLIHRLTKLSSRVMKMMMMTR